MEIALRASGSGYVLAVENLDIQLGQLLKGRIACGSFALIPSCRLGGNQTRTYGLPSSEVARGASKREVNPLIRNRPSRRRLGSADATRSSGRKAGLPGAVFLTLLLAASGVATLAISPSPVSADSVPQVGPWTETTDYGATSGDTGAGGVAGGRHLLLGS